MKAQYPCAFQGIYFKIKSPRFEGFSFYKTQLIAFDSASHLYQ